MTETNKREFSIRRAFLLPLGLLLLLIVLLLATAMIQGQEAGKLIILAAMILPIVGLFVESAARKAEIGDEAVTVHKFLRDRSLRYDELTSLDAVVVRKRAFLSLSTMEGFLIISNAYEDFPALVRALLAKVSDDVIGDEVRQMAADPPVKSGDIVSCWVGVVLLALILVIQLRGFF
jgi:uncharacterized membrane protein